MKRSFLFMLLPLVLALPVISSSVFATSRGIRVTTEQGKNVYLYDDYHALVIGVSNYEKWPRLPNAVSDAKEVAAKLSALGFEVTLVADPTSREMETLLSKLVYEIGREQNRAILFYYAGHGETETLADGAKMGYIIPRDCPRLDKDPFNFSTHAISMRDIESVSLRIKAKHLLMLFDSCFSGSLFSLVRAAPDDITEKSTLPVRQYITAGREDEQVPDKSMFKRCFLLGLDGDADLTGDGYITGSELGMYLSDKVVNYTHRRQHPQYGKINNPELDRGDFVFVAEMDLEAKLRATEERLRREIEEKKALEAELERLKAKLGEERLVSIPKKAETPIITKVTLRDTPDELGQYDIRKMLEAHNFYEKYLNEGGDFPNDFVDNGDGSITDRATGLIWEKGGSGSWLRYREAQRYIVRLNEKGFLGYHDWRIPTLEELLSLLEGRENEKGQHISPLFKNAQSECWSVDRCIGHSLATYADFNYVVDFSKAVCASSATRVHFGSPGQSIRESCYVRAVRTIK